MEIRPTSLGVLLLAFVASMLEANTVDVFVVGAPTPPRSVAFGATATAVEQDPTAVETSLVLDRPSRRVIQQGLRNEGFDPGALDGLFGPRTRAAIKSWQEARGETGTGYLDEVQADWLRSVGSPVAEAADVEDPGDLLTSDGQGVAAGDGNEAPSTPSPTATPIVESPVHVNPDPVNCDEWNTQTFFRTATVAVVRACLAAGSDVGEVATFASRDRHNGFTPLHYAARFNDNVGVLEALVAAGADVSARDAAGAIPLEYVRYLSDRPFWKIAGAESVLAELMLEAGTDVSAARNALLRSEAFHGSLADLEGLLAAGTVVNAPNAFGETALHYAAERSNSDPAVIDALLAAGAAVNALNTSGQTALHYAAWSSDPAAIDALLAAGAAVSAATDYGMTPLHYAAENNRNPAVIEALVAAGAAVSATTDNFPRRTPLHYAAENNGNPTIIEALVAAGADVSQPDMRGDAPLHLAAGSNANPTVIEALLAAGAGVMRRTEFERTPLHAAAGANNPAVIETLLAAGADVMARDTWGRTPLYSAASGNEPAAIETLLAAGADVMARDDRSADTPLHGAGNYNDNPATIQALLAGGADVMARNRFRQTPLHTAVWRNDNPTVIEALLAAGADVAARDQSGETPLHAASYNRSREVIETLLAAGADVTARDRDGRTPLHIPLASNPIAIETLVAAGADVMARTNQGDTPLHDVIRMPTSLEFNPLVEVLLAVGAEVDAQNSDGDTALHLAARGYEKGRDRGIDALLAGGADPRGENAAGETPWDLAQENEDLRESDAYWRMNDARFRAPRPESRRQLSTPLSGEAASVQRQSPACEIRGYPSPTDVQSLGLSWCGPSVGFDVRAFALHAAGAWCAIGEGTSSTPEQVTARQEEINSACDMLDALGSRGSGQPCRCPAGYRP